MDKINILYIDDSHEVALGRYLGESYKNEEYQIEYFEIKFNPSDGYDTLIKDPLVQISNIIFIDSRLFENRTALGGKFTGEEFKIILKKYFPFIEVIVITQNGADPSLGTISKFDSRKNKTAMEYYSENLPAYIDSSIRNITIYRRLAEIFKKNENWESILKEKIINSLQGIGTYDELTKNDIDHIIKAFKELEEKLDVN